jgi:hypothetical protein
MLRNPPKLRLNDPKNEPVFLFYDIKHSSMISLQNLKKNSKILLERRARRRAKQEIEAKGSEKRPAQLRIQAAEYTACAPNVP